MYKPGDLIFVKNNGWLSGQVRSITRSEFDHVGVLWPREDGIMVVDATPLSGVSVRPIEVFRNNEYRVCRLKSPYQPTVPEKMLEYCKGEIGRWYDFVQIFCLYVMILFRIKRELDPVDVGSAFVCSELVAQAGEHAGVRFTPGATDRVTPEDIFNSGLLYEIISEE